MIATLVNDPNVGVGLFMSNPRDGYEYAESYSRAVMRAAEMTEKPVALVSNYSMADDSDLAFRLRRSGVPLLRGTRNALLAMRHVMDDRDYRDRHAGVDAAEPVPVPFNDQVVARWRSHIAETSRMSEADGLAMLADFGIATPRMARVASLDELETALSYLQFPVVIKPPRITRIKAMLVASGWISKTQMRPASSIGRWLRGLGHGHSSWRWCDLEPNCRLVRSMIQDSVRW